MEYTMLEEVVVEERQCWEKCIMEGTVDRQVWEQGEDEKAR